MNEGLHLIVIKYDQFMRLMLVNTRSLLVDRTSAVFASRERGVLIQFLEIFYARFGLFRNNI